MSWRFEGAADLRRLLQETRRQRPTALIGASSIREALGLHDEALTLLLADAVGAGDLLPVDIVRCSRCRREAEAGASLEHFVCHECEGETPVVFRVYSVTDKIFSDRSVPTQKKTRRTRSRRRENPLSHIPFLRRFFRNRGMILTT